MRPRPLFSFPATLAALAALSSFAPVSASAGLLVERSPFLPPRDADVPVAAATTLQYVGFYETPAGIQFRVLDPARKAAAFVKLRVRDDHLELTAREFDAERGILTVEHHGQTLALPERRAQIRAAAPPPMAGTLPRPALLVGPPPPANAGTEAARLQSVVDEIRRRREAAAPPPAK